jgi:hypothetical protein
MTTTNDSATHVPDPVPVNPASAEPPRTPPPLEPALDENPDLKSLFEAVLRRPHSLLPLLGQRPVTLRLVAVAIGSFLVFGLVLGCFAKQEQLWAAPVKLGAGLIISALICFPSLFIFTTLAGGRSTPGQLATGLAGAMALAGLLLLGVAPAVWVFAESTDSFGFMGFLSLVSWLVAMAFALRFLKAMTWATGAIHLGPLFIWGTVFTLVTLQMTTTLRPVLGRSDRFLTQEKKFFLQHWVECAGTTLTNGQQAPGGKDARPRPAKQAVPDSGR